MSENTVDRDKVEQVLDAVRPSLEADGGSCELVDIDDDGVVMVELTGACAGCAFSQMTLSMGIERVLKEQVPGVTAVRAV